MRGHKFYQGSWVAPNTKLFALLESKKPEDQKSAKRLAEFCDLAAKCNYEVGEIRKLRERFSDVI